jgi:trimethylamine--corrinoid protein Co-methyltransferase
MVKRFVKGIPVNAETLAEEVINSVGPAGNYLAEEHTVKHFREEIWRPALLDRQNFHAWKQNGAKTMEQRIKKNSGYT